MYAKNSTKEKYNTPKLIETINVLIENKADVNITDRNGKTPLDIINTVSRKIKHGVYYEKFKKMNKSLSQKTKKKSIFNCMGKKQNVNHPALEL